jgi:hypothetical protein
MYVSDAHSIYPVQAVQKVQSVEAPNQIFALDIQVDPPALQTRPIAVSSLDLINPAAPTFFWTE